MSDHTPIRIDGFTEKCPKCGEKVMYAVGTGTIFHGASESYEDWRVIKHDYCPRCGTKIEREGAEENQNITTREFCIELEKLLAVWSPKADTPQTDFPTEWCETCELWQDNNCRGVAECKRNIEMLKELNKLYEADTPQTESLE